MPSSECSFPGRLSLTGSGNRTLGSDDTACCMVLAGESFRYPRWQEKGKTKHISGTSYHHSPLCRSSFWATLCTPGKPPAPGPSNRGSFSALLRCAASATARRHAEPPPTVSGLNLAVTPRARSYLLGVSEDLQERRRNVLVQLFQACRT